MTVVALLNILQNSSIWVEIQSQFWNPNTILYNFHFEQINTYDLQQRFGCFYNIQNMNLIWLKCGHTVWKMQIQWWHNRPCLTWDSNTKQLAKEGLDSDISSYSTICQKQEMIY